MTIDTQCKRITAIHEAGHVAILWMFGNENDIEFVDMRGNFGSNGFVRTRQFDLLKLYAQFDQSNLQMRQLARLQIQRTVMYSLAGYAAENVEGERTTDWFLGWEVREMLNDHEEWEGLNDNDVTRAFDAARALLGDNGRMRQFVRRMASWTDEALAHPPLWAGVEAVAERLMTVKIRIAGYKLCPILAKAWGKQPTLPYMEMGRKWRRRFRVK